MSLDFVVEVWDALRSHVDSNERKDAADTLINLLIENDYEATDIKEAFRGDKDVLGALKFYAEQHDEDDDEDDEDDYQDAEEEWD
jgi:hypothetical protein